MARTPRQTKGKQEEERPPAGSPLVVKTIGEVCLVLDISEPTFRKHLQRGCPGATGGKGKQNGTFRLNEIVAWFRENVWQPKPKADRDELENQKLEADIRIANLKADNLAGTLVERQAVEATLKTILNVVRARLDQIPIELSNSLSAKQRAEFKRDAQNKIDLIKMELAEIGRNGGTNSL